MKHIVIKQPPLAIGSGVKLIHIYTTNLYGKEGGYLLTLR